MYQDLDIFLLNEFIYQAKMSNRDVGFRGEGRTCKSKSYPGFSSST